MMMFSTQMLFVFLTMSTFDATRGSNLRGKEQDRKLSSGCLQEDTRHPDDEDQILDIIVESSEEEQRCRAFDNQECDEDHVTALCSTGGELGCCPDGILTHWDVDEGAEDCFLVLELSELVPLPLWDTDRCRPFDNQECNGDFPTASFCSSGGEQGCCPDGITLHWEWEEGAKDCTTDDPSFYFWDMDGRGCEWIRDIVDNPDYQDEDNYSRSKCLDANNKKEGLCPSCEMNNVSNACPSVCA
mmetsp:Transcript_26733/g.27179  ORF Transcript_26733/g.27179 Transcript_26733/m.27179 type:complete len:243 (-) Transcript_26733:275-1003(-)